MFTGLVEEIGIIKSVSQAKNGKIFEVSASFSNELKLGESVAINGACQSVTLINSSSFQFFSMQETLNNTNLNSLKVGDSVNLERALTLSSRLDGHLVQGHIDSVAKLKSIKVLGDYSDYIFECDTKYIVLKGSVAINGISLTVSGVNDNSFKVSIIPQTLEKTNLKDTKAGDVVNIETDILGKYVEKFLSSKDNKKGLTLDFLRENGF